MAAIIDTKFNERLNSMSSNFKASLDEYLQYEKGSLLNDRYKYGGNIQNGSFGKVTCALDTLTGQKVAVKAMKRSIPGVSFMARHEISVMKRLGIHDNICQMVDSFETRKYVIVVLEYVSGGDLYDAIHSHSKLGLGYQEDPKLFARLCKELITVTQYAHSRGIYHRDIKPENVLLMEDGGIKLCDWGLATSAIRCHDFNVGTEKYMAPEALTKPDTGDHYNAKEADAWSIGITLLFTLFGKCPFRKALPTDGNYSIFRKSAAFLYDYYPNFSATGFTAIVQKLMKERDLDAGLEIILKDGITKGFTVDQEYKFELAGASDLMATSTNESQLGGEFYMFEDTPRTDSKAIEDDLLLADDDEQAELSELDNMGALPYPAMNIEHHHKTSISSSTKSGMTNSLFDRPAISIINSVGTIPEENYLSSGKLSWCDETDDLDIDNCIMNFESILKTHNSQTDMSEAVLSNDTLT